MKTLMTLITILMLNQSCNNPKTDPASSEEKNASKENNQDKAEFSTWSGTISKAEMTSYQYGTHQLTGICLEDTKQKENKIFALKSDKILLDNWMGKKVLIKGNKVKGYPLENGPELIEVINVYD
jgi:hypothetical protein